MKKPLHAQAALPRTVGNYILQTYVNMLNVFERNLIAAQQSYCKIGVVGAFDVP